MLGPIPSAAEDWSLCTLARQLLDPWGYTGPVLRSRSRRRRCLKSSEVPRGVEICCSSCPKSHAARLQRRVCRLSTRSRPEQDRPFMFSIMRVMSCQCRRACNHACQSRDLRPRRCIHHCNSNVPPGRCKRVGATESTPAGSDYDHSLLLFTCFIGHSSRQISVPRGLWTQKCLGAKKEKETDQNRHGQ